MTDAKALVETLRQPWRHGEHVDSRGLVLDEPLILDGLEVRGFDLTRAVLRGGLSARGTHFRGLAWLYNAQIEGTCDLSGAQIRTDLRADGLRAETVRLDNCEIQGCLSFEAAKMAALNMQNALVMANMTLEEASISKVFDMTDAEIMGGFWTAGAQIGSLKDDNSQISGRVSLPI